jgi:gluconolactonase
MHLNQNQKFNIISKSSSLRQKAAVNLIILIMNVYPCFSQNTERTAKKELGANLQKLAGEFLFAEGPASDNQGNIYFTDQPRDRIMLWSTDGELSTFMQPSGRSNGLFFDSENNLWACADEKNELWIIRPDKTVIKIPLFFEGKKLNGPNDLWISPSGGIYFTDPFYKRPWWDHKSMPQEKQSVYYLCKDHKTVKRVADDLIQPNGIVGTSDGKRLFVSDIGGNKTWSYTIENNGMLTNKVLFCEMGSDGMTIDKRGNIYLTGRGVTIFNKNGILTGTIDVPENWTGNVCFGGKKKRTLFITASKGLYCIKLRKKPMGAD